MLVAGELGQRAAEVRESDKGGGESWGATGGIWVLEALELMTEHRNGSYPLRGGWQLGGGSSLQRWGGAGTPAQAAHEKHSAHAQGCVASRRPLACRVHNVVWVPSCSGRVLTSAFLLPG